MTIRDQLKLPNDVKIATYASPEPSADELTFLQNIGVEYVTCFIQAAKASPEYYLSRKQLFAEAGITLYGLGNIGVHNQDAIVLNLPGRDAKIEEYQAAPAQPGLRRHSVHHLRAHGQRHLV